MRKMDLTGGLERRVGKDLSPKTPNRAYPYLKRLVQYLEKELSDVPHYYQGGFFIGNYTGEPRYTQDVDMTVVYLPSYERVKDVLGDFGNLLLAEGTISKFSVKSNTSERSSGGAKYYAPDGSILFSIDIGFHENPLRTQAVAISDIGTVSVSCVEQMLCDKVSAIYSDRKFRRVKDLFDAWHILSACKIDDDIFIECLVRAGIAPLPSSNGPFTYDNVDRMEEAYNSVVVFTVESKEAYSKPTFAEVVELVGGFCARFSDAEV